MTTRIAIVTALVMALLAPTASTGGHPTFVTYNCHNVKVEPRQVIFACGDANYSADHLQWKKWHRDRARARGIFHINDCKPNCAEGQFHERTGTLILRRPERCANVDKRVFMRAKAIYDQPFQGRTEEVSEMFCPFTS